MEVEQEIPKEASLVTGNKKDDLLEGVDAEMASQDNSAIEDVSFAKFRGARPNRNGFRWI